MEGGRPNPMSNQDFFATLPSEIIIDILARLPLRTVLRCKYVCKSWLNLIHSLEFYKLHLPKSVPLLVIHHFEQQPPSNAYNCFEVSYGLRGEPHFNPLTKVNLVDHTGIRGSANGLLFLVDKSREHKSFLICNPITREYVEFANPRPASYEKVTYGFGASRITGQVKVVWIFQNWSDSNILECYCKVYTLGTGSWRRVASPNHLKYGGRDKPGSFLNGNLHWLVQDLNGDSWISCFDLESELFNTFFTPDLSLGNAKMVPPLRDCLCLCQGTEYKIVIWVMKEYGVEESWTKELVIDQEARDFDMLYRVRFDSLHPIIVLSDRILIAWDGGALRYYYKKKRSTLKTIVGKCFHFCDAILHTPSFLSLRSLGMEDVKSL